MEIVRTFQTPSYTDVSEWLTLVDRAYSVHIRAGWDFIDILRDGIEQFGGQNRHAIRELYELASQQIGLSVKTLQNYVSLSRSFPEDRRNGELSIGHYMAVQGLSSGAQEELLDNAAASGLSVENLRYEVKKLSLDFVPDVGNEIKNNDIYPTCTNGNGANGHNTTDNTYEQLADDLSGDESGYDWTDEETPETQPLTYFDGSPVSAPSASMAVHYSSEKPDWETPQDLFDLLNEEFHFTLDVCAVPETAKCAAYFTPEDDGLLQDWTRNVCWMNPPYGDDIPDWMNKARREARVGATVVCLVPARVDTTWWWDNCIYGEIRFLKGRLKFKQGGNEVTSAPFPSAVIVLSPQTTPTTVWWDWKKQCTDSKNS